MIEKMMTVKEINSLELCGELEKYRGNQRCRALMIETTENPSPEVATVRAGLSGM
jgi:hypothetical protein